MAEAAPRAGAGRVVAGALRAGAVHGALLYGSGISLLHVLHDRVPSVWNAAVLFAWSNLLYGLLSAAVFGGAAVSVVVARRLLRRAPKGETKAPIELAAGAFAFHLGFWFFAANYGLTYDELPFGEPAGPAAMLAWLALRTLALAAAALLASWLFARLWRRLAASGARGRAAVAGLWVAALGAHLVLAGVFRPAPAPSSAALEASAAALPDPSALRPPYKVALVAADGADWRVIRPMVEAGELPNLARLMAAGAHGPLETLPDANSAVLWASIYSGLEPADHGVLDFYTVRLAGMTAGVYPVHRTAFKELAGYLERAGLAERVTVDRRSVRAPLVWEIAAALGRSVGVVDGFYFAYPAPTLPGPDGFFLSYGADRFYQRVSKGRRPPSSAPGAEEYARPPSLLDELGEVLEGWEFDWQSRSLLRLLDGGRPQPDLVYLYSHQPDAVQHWRWRAYEPERFLRVAPAEVAEYGDDIPAFHRELDRFLGELFARLEPGTVVILASDHGHSPTLFHAMDSQHRHGPPGILVMAGGPVRRGVRLEDAHVYDLFPTVLHLLGLPVPETADGRVLEEALEPGFRTAAPVTEVASYDALLPLFLPAPERGGEAEERRRQEELEKLRALGYVR